jgi:hypothetical protein
MFRLLSAISIFILTTLIAVPSYSDDVTINLDSTTPYVDIPVTVTEPVDATISTVTGTPQNNPGFIDSWIEVWQGVFKLAANDDGAHSASNVLASIITMPLTAGEYFIRATSFAYMCCNSYPTGTYLLSTNLIVSTPVPTPTPISPTPTETNSPSPSPTQTSSSPTPEPTPEPSSPSPLPTDTPQPSTSPEVPVDPGPEPSEPDPVPSVEFLQPTELPTPDVQDTLEEVVDSSFNDFPSSLENELPSLLELPLQEEISSTDETESLLEYFQEFSIQNLQEAFQQISESISSALSTVSNLGSDLSEENREEAQQIVLAAIILPQLATAVIRRVK